MKNEAEVTLRKRSRQEVEGAKAPQYLFTLAACVMVVSGGAVIGWSSPALVVLTKPNSTFVLDEHQASWAGSIMTLGAMLGALPAGPVADALGRKMVLWSLGVPMMAAWALKVFASTAWLLYAGRFLAGLALGATCTVAPLYIAEIAENSVRGALCSYFQLSLVVGILFAFVAGASMPYSGWCFLCGALPLIFMGAFLSAPETPAYLVRRGLRQKAADSLRRLRGDKYDIVKELNNLQDSVSDGDGDSWLTALRTRAGAKALVISLGLMVFQQLSGINAVVFYSSSIFKGAGTSIDPDVASIIVGLAQVVATYVGSLLMDRAGRRILLISSGGVLAICLGALGKYFQLKAEGNEHLALVPLVSVVLYMVMFAVGWGPVPWLMSGELLPPELRGPGTSLAVGLNWCLAFTVTKTFPDLMRAVGPPACFWGFGVICIVSVGFTILLVPETKGKSLARIQEELGGRRNHSETSSCDQDL